MNSDIENNQSRDSLTNDLNDSDLNTNNEAVAEDSPESKNENEMPLTEHIRELRKRLVYSILILIVASIGMYLFSDSTFELLNAPYFASFPESSLIGTGPAEAFILKLKTAFFSGIIVSSPLLFLQAWWFIAPGLHEHEKKLVYPFIFFTSALFLSGIYLCYKLILPVTYAFFISQYSSIGVTPQIRITEHFSLTIRCLLGFGLAFEIPIISYFLGKFGIVSSKNLISWFRYAIVAIFALAAVITPTPDMVTQTLFATPLLVLYGVSILVIMWVEKRQLENKSQD